MSPRYSPLPLRFTAPLLMACARRGCLHQLVVALMFGRVVKVSKLSLCDSTAHNVRAIYTRQSILPNARWKTQLWQSSRACETMGYGGLQYGALFFCIWTYPRLLTIKTASRLQASVQHESEIFTFVSTLHCAPLLMACARRGCLHQLVVAHFKVYW